MRIATLSLLALILVASARFAMADAALTKNCESDLKSFPGKSKIDALKIACSQVQVLDGCVSEEGKKIYHFNKSARAGVKDPKSILVFSLIHGDELPSGSVARSWMERLATIDTRNNWRILPVLNPDGVARKTRMNANGIDINRNFPTKAWEQEAIQYWEKKTSKDKRRFPGNEAGSAKETKCAMAHIEEYKPDLILSVHTPYGVLDFDGPKIPPPKFKPIPWRSLGNYPGSLGRFMWVDRAKPTLTIELHGSGVTEKLEKFDQLQDITGDIAIAAGKIMETGDSSPAKTSEKGAGKNSGKAKEMDSKDK